MRARAGSLSCEPCRRRRCARRSPRTPRPHTTARGSGHLYTMQLYLERVASGLRRVKGGLVETRGRGGATGSKERREGEQRGGGTGQCTRRERGGSKRRRKRSDMLNEWEEEREREERGRPPSQPAVRALASTRTEPGELLQYGLCPYGRPPCCCAHGRGGPAGPVGLSPGSRNSNSPGCASPSVPSPAGASTSSRTSRECSPP